MEKRIRLILRWMHIVLGLVIMCYIYSPFHEIAVFQWIVKIAVIPIIALSGIWLWKFKKVNAFLKIRK
jgi:hypothetical protein